MALPEGTNGMEVVGLLIVHILAPAVLEWVTYELDLLTIVEVKLQRGLVVSVAFILL